MPRNVPCKFHLLGRCNKGEDCQFYHGPGLVPDVEVCRYYQRGFCAAGQSCRFQHPKGDPADSVHREYSSTAGQGDATDCTDDDPGTPAAEGEAELGEYDENGVWWSYEDEYEDGGNCQEGEGLGVPPEDDEYDEEAWELWATTQSGPEWKDRNVCPYFSANGRCPIWRSCPYPHGRFCAICQKWCLHPYSEAQRLSHTEFCSKRADREQSAAISAEQECSICLERVMEKPSCDRRFGLLACDHTFCLRCVRGWRSNLNAGVDIDTAVRCCPVCRQTTHFVTPSKVWPRTPEEKERIVEQYKLQLAGIECKYWETSAPGDKRCPFGTSCFYRHSGAEDMPAPRKFMSADGEVKFGQPVFLSDFLGDMRL